MSDRLGSRYSIDCAGHSLGGGACAYAATQVADVHAVTINPISTGSLATNRAFLIDNYVVDGEVADLANTALQRGATGWVYPVSSTFTFTPEGAVAVTTPAVEQSLISLHSLSGAIDFVGATFGLVRNTLIGH